jgi:CheY-like chemotaxis protein
MQQASGAARLSREQLVQNLCASGLFAPADLVSFTPDAATGDADTLVRQLLDAGKLTPHQVEAVCDGRLSELVIDDYEILERLGAGGMGTVFKARHRRMKRVVALKVLPRHSGQAESFVQRFQREVEVISQLSHPNVVMAYDAGEADLGHYLVMEFVNGQDLSNCVQRNGPFAVTEAVNLLVQAARGLEYAHSRGIIHRDVKPANLLRDTSGVVKVADLGLARLSAGLAGGGNSSITQAGGIMGTVDYMPPEQAFDSTAVDHRADVYSLGATLHYLLTGQPPYRGDNVMATLFKHSTASVPSLSAARPDVPAALDAVFKKMMAKTPAERQQSMAEVIRELETLAISPAAPPVPAAPGTPAPAPGSSTMVGEADAGCMTIDLAAKARPAAPGAVLLVEPSRTQANIIRKYLLDLGETQILVAPTGAKAVEAMNGQPVRVVICSMHLDDMTGAQLLQKVRSDPRLASAGFVIITASGADSADLTSLRGAARTALLAKPFDVTQLRIALLAAAGTPGAKGSSFADRRVLLVDDSASARAHVRSVLTGLGFRHVAEASDGTDAVAQLTREKFDLVVTDYNMPLMDGRALVGFVRQKSASPDVPILMVTTEKDPERLKAVRELGVSEICEKSFPPEVVRGILERLLP